MSGSNDYRIRRMIDAALEEDLAENPPDFDAVRTAARFRENRLQKRGTRARNLALMAAAAVICVVFGAAALTRAAKSRIRQEIQDDAEYFVDRLFSESMLQELDTPREDLFGNPSTLEELSYSEG